MISYFKISKLGIYWLRKSIQREKITKLFLLVEFLFIITFHQYITNISPYVKTTASVQCTCYTTTREITR